MDDIYIASKNKHKIDEFAQLLLPLSATIRGLPHGCPDSSETGTTFEENALQKAAFYRRFVAHGWVLADDSGLSVPALKGAPGVMSARYAGVHGDDEANIAKLLRELSGVPAMERVSEFVSVIAMVHVDTGETFVVRGSLHGMIANKPRGEHGFGYDSVFFLSARNCTVAELSPEEKNRISHRANAVKALIRAWEANFHAGLRNQ